jgi:hypothetical protein
MNYRRGLQRLRLNETRTEAIERVLAQANSFSAVPKAALPKAALPKAVRGLPGLVSLLPKKTL